MTFGKKFFPLCGLAWAARQPAWAGTCSLCREMLRSNGNAGLIAGYYWSIVLIVAIPLVVLALGWRYARRRY